MVRYILDSTGKILTALVANNEMLKLNTPPNAVYFDVDEERDMSDYYDFHLHSFVSIGEPPTPHHTFDYTIRKWIDLRSLYDFKEQKWDEIKSERDSLEFEGFEFEGNTYDSDQVSQGRIVGAALAGIDQVWTLADNTTVELSASQLQQLYAALQAHVASVHERGRIARQSIYYADTREGVEAVQL